MQKRIWNVPELEPAFIIAEKKEKGNGFFPGITLSHNKIRITLKISNLLSHEKIQAYRPGNGGACDCADKPDLSSLLWKCFF